MKDLNAAREEREQRDRSFTIAGEEFTIRAGVLPSAIKRWTDLINGEYVVKENGVPMRDPEPALNAARILLRTAQSDGNGKATVDAPLIEALRKGLELSVPISTLNESEALEIYEETVRAYLEPGQEEAWARVTDPEAKHPLSDEDYAAILKFAVEVTTGRPTGQPSDSSEKRDGSGTSSKDGSSSLEVLGSAV